MSRHARLRVRLALLCTAALAGSAVLAGCTEGAADEVGNASSGSSSSESGDGDTGSGDSGGSSGSGGEATSYAVEAPGPLKERLHRADVLVTGKETLPDDVVEKIKALPGIEAVLPISIASSSIDGRTLNVAAVDPGEFRRFTPPESAYADFVWERIAGGEVAVDNTVSKKLVSKGDMMTLSNAEDAPEVHVGAYAPLVQRSVGVGESQPAIQAVVNTKRGEQLGLPEDNGLLVSTGLTTPSELTKRFERILGDRATLQTLALEFDVGPQTAVLTGGTVTDAVGTFSYTTNSDGTVDPDPAWVREFIRSEEVPILGKVTCNKGMLPQLRAALAEIVQRGLASKIHPDEYAGCYYPRFIGYSPSNGLSLHSWGIAVDLNVPGNQRGTAGEMDRTVVSIFKKWGFAWGGDWNYTDPMHFEMNRVVRAG
jgi:hypothetical protein